MHFKSPAQTLFSPPTETAILTGSIPGLWRPGVLESCISRLSGVLAASDSDPILAGLVPWISRRIVESGEVVLLLDDYLRLLPVEHYELQGSSSQRVYKSLTVAGPTRTLEYRGISPEQVVHAVFRPAPGMPWRGRSWRDSGYVVRQLAAIDVALRQEAAAPRGTLLPVAAGEAPGRLKKLLQGFRNLRGGLSTHPLLGRQGELPGPSPSPVRLQTSTLPELLRAREDLSAALAESLGFARVILGMGSGGQVSRPDGLRAWLASTASGWASILREELRRVLERVVRLDLSPALSGLIPWNQRLVAVGRLVQQGVNMEEAKRLAGLS